MNTHRTRNIAYCSAVKINTVTDHPAIIVDQSSFEGAKIPYRTEIDSGYSDVHKGDFVIERNGHVTGALSEQDFHRYWEPIPATVKFIKEVSAIVLGAERGGQQDHYDVEIWIDGCEYGSGRLTLGDVKAFLAEQKGVV
jgi:hypothetical protein